MRMVATQDNSGNPNQKQATDHVVFCPAAPCTINLAVSKWLGGSADSGSK